MMLSLSIRGVGLQIVGAIRPADVSSGHICTKPVMSSTIPTA